MQVLLINSTLIANQNAVTPQPRPSAPNQAVDLIRSERERNYLDGLSSQAYISFSVLIQMAAHALSDPKHFELTSKMANQLLDDVIANHADPTTRFQDPEFFPLRVATMVDLNRSLSSRRPTCFDFSTPKTRPWPQDTSRFSDHEVTVSMSGSRSIEDLKTKSYPFSGMASLLVSLCC
jgi:hypothetical protein